MFLRHALVRVLALAGICAIACAGARADTRQLRAVPAPNHDPLFIDYATVKRSGDKIAFRYVLDVPLARETPGASRRWTSNDVEASIDCARNTYSIGDVYAYSGPGATGNLVGSYSSTSAERKPAAIVPDSTFDYLARHVCRQRL